MRVSVLRTLALLILPSLGHAATFLGLGDLPGGVFQSYATSSSDGGIAVVGSSSSASGTEAFRWSGGVMTGLGDLPGGTETSGAYGVSADGLVVVGAGNSASGTEAFRWSGGVMTGLGDLPGGQSLSVAYSVSADGLVVVGQGASASGTEAFRWSGGVMTGLGDLPGGGFGSAAFAASADGSVIVGAGNSASGTEAFRWSGGVMTGLGDLPGGIEYSDAYGVSADGLVVVGRSSGATGYEPFRWVGGVMTGLGDLGNSGDGIATAVSSDGSVVVGSVRNRAFIWTQSSGMQSLFSVLVASGVTGLSGWRLQSAESISADGNWIAGIGVNPLGNTEAFLANISAISANAADDGPIEVVEGVAKNISVGVNDTGFTNPVTVAVTTQPTKGTITTISPPGPAAGMTVTYTANVGAAGDDSFIYEMTDSSPATDSATVSINIGPTPDTVPDPFAFIDQTDVALTSVVTSNAITVAGVNVPTAISVVGGGYAINGGTFTTLAGTVNNGNTVTVRQTSSGTPFTATNTTVTIGGVADTFSLTTGPDTDGDGVVNRLDNCTLVPNSQSGNVPGSFPPIPQYQLDTDGDGYGNICDADLNNSGTVTTADYGLLRSVLGELAAFNALTAAADINGSGTVTTSDFGLLRARLGTAPGPSGLHP